MPSRRRSRNKNLRTNLSEVQRRLRYLERRPARTKLSGRVVSKEAIAPRAVGPDQADFGIPIVKPPGSPTDWQDGLVNPTNGDIVINPDTGDAKVYDESSSSFITLSDSSKVTTYYNDNEPTGANEGDLWFDTDDGFKLYRYTVASGWQSVQDSTIAAALAAANAAQNTANQKNRVYRQTNQPTGDTYSAGDLWFDTDSENTMYRYGLANTSNVSFKQLTNNVATITTATPHLFAAQEQVTVAGVDSVFNGTYTITEVPSSTTFKYAKTNANVPNTSTSGTVTSSEGWKPAVLGSNALTNISANKITTGTLDAANVDVVNLNASNISVGFLAADRIATGSLNAAVIGAGFLSASVAVLGQVIAEQVTSGILTGQTVTTRQPNTGERVQLGGVSLGELGNTVEQDAISFFDTITINGSPTDVRIGVITPLELNVSTSSSTSSVTAKSLTDNIATLTTATAHAFVLGQSITVTGVDATFNGTYTVSFVPSPDQVSYSKASANVSTTSSSGTINGAANTSTNYGIMVGGENGTPYPGFFVGKDPLTNIVNVYAGTSSNSKVAITENIIEISSQNAYMFANNFSSVYANDTVFVSGSNSTLISSDDFLFLGATNLTLISSNNLISIDATPNGSIMANASDILLESTGLLTANGNIGFQATTNTNQLRLDGYSVDSYLDYSSTWSFFGLRNSRAFVNGTSVFSFGGLDGDVAFVLGSGSISPTPTPTPIPTPTPGPSPTPTPGPSPTPTPGPSPTPTPAPYLPALFVNCNVQTSSSVSGYVTAENESPTSYTVNLSTSVGIISPTSFILNGGGGLVSQNWTVTAVAPGTSVTVTATITALSLSESDTCSTTGGSPTPTPTPTPLLSPTPTPSPTPAPIVSPTPTPTPTPTPVSPTPTPTPVASNSYKAVFCSDGTCYQNDNSTSCAANEAFVLANYANVSLFICNFSTTYPTCPTCPSSPTPTPTPTPAPAPTVGPSPTPTPSPTACGGCNCTFPNTEYCCESCCFGVWSGGQCLNPI